MISQLAQDALLPLSNSLDQCLNGNQLPKKGPGLPAGV